MKSTKPTTSEQESGPVAAPAGARAAGHTSRERIAQLLQHQGAVIVLVLMVLIMSVSFDTFATTGNFSHLAIQMSFLAIVALGMTFVIFTGGIDLSVGSVFALGGVLAAWGSQFGLLPALLLPLVVCGLIGLVQGLIIAKGGLAPFIVTLAGLLFARGLVLLVSDQGVATYKVPEGSAFLQLARGELLGLRYTVWITIALFIIGSVVVHRTNFGSVVLAIGGQEDAANMMGLPVRRSKITVYVVSGVLAGLAGLLTASYTASGVATLGLGMELQAISAVVLGGTLLTGGAGTVFGTFVGVALLQVIANFINRIGLTNSNWQAVTSGVLLILVATIQSYLSRVERR